MDLFCESYYLSDRDEGYDDDFYSEGGVTVAEVAGGILLGSAIGIALGQLELGLLAKLGTWSAKKIKNNLGRAIQDVFEIIKDREVTTDDIKDLRKAIATVSRETNRIGAVLRNHVFTDNELQTINELSTHASEISLFIRNKRVMKRDQARFKDRLQDFIKKGIECLEIVKDKPNE